MKIYSWNSQKISINDNGKIKTISPFFMVDENKSHLFQNSNFTEIANIFNIEEMQNISSNMQMIMGDLKDEIINKTQDLFSMQEKLEETILKINQIDEKIKEINEVKEKYDKTLENMENIFENLKEYETKIDEKEQNIQENIKNIEKNINTLSVKTSDILEQAENKMASKYFNMRLSLEKIYEKYIAEIKNNAQICQKYAENSKKWATNPINIPVENNLYSARHYALLRKKEVKNG